MRACPASAPCRPLCPCACLARTLTKHFTITAGRDSPCLPLSACARPARTLTKSSSQSSSQLRRAETHFIPHFQGAHVAPALHHSAAALAARHKRQLGLLLVEALRRTGGNAEQRRFNRMAREAPRSWLPSHCTAVLGRVKDLRDGRMSEDAQGTPPQSKEALHPDNSIGVRPLIPRPTCSCKASAKLSAAAATRMRTAFGCVSGGAGSCCSFSVACGWPSGSAGWPSFSHTSVL